jgi:putative acetyltransferase
MKLISYDSQYKDDSIKLYKEVFTASESQSEGELASKLASDLLTTTPEKDFYGFLALDNEVIVGIIIFSRITLESGTNAFILSPVAVDNEYQGKHTGQSLIDFGIEYLKDEGVELLVTYGDPYYYIKVGFKPVNAQVIIPPYKLSMAEGWLAQPLTQKTIEEMAGKVVCVPALDKEEIW